MKHHLSKLAGVPDDVPSSGARSTTVHVGRLTVIVGQLVTIILPNSSMNFNTGRHSDKKHPNLAQTLRFLSQKRAETLNILSQNSKKVFRKRGRVGGRGSPPEGSTIPSFPSCTMSG